jgi:predicted transport protein
MTHRIRTRSSSRRRRAWDDDDALASAQYAGDRARFRPIKDLLVAAATALDARIEVRPDYITFSHDRQFAIVRPEDDRLDLFLRLPDGVTSERLLPPGTGGSGSVNARVALLTTADVDAELLDMVRLACEAN